MWKCEACGERFANENSWHSCGQHTLESLFGRCEPVVREIFDRLVEAVQAEAEARVIPQKTRVTFQTRIRFLSVYPRKSSLLCGFLFGSRSEHARFEKVESLSRRNHVHTLRLRHPAEIDAEVRQWICEAHAVGRQEHLA